MGAGNFTDRLQRLVRSTTKNTDNGQDEETFTPGDWYWCRIEVTGGRRQEDYGAMQTGADATIFIRNTPALTALDRMQDDTTVYVLDNIRQGDNELIVEARYYDELAL